MKPFLMKLDLSQVEGRIVYMLTRDPHLVAEAQSKPWEYNMHESNAKLIFKIKEVNKDQYYLGKKAVHGAQRAMTGYRLSDELLKEGYVRTQDECDWMLLQYHTAKPAIQEIYFAETRQKVWNERSLTNSWGRTIKWRYERWDMELYKEAYSWMPQSEAAELLNQWGLIPTWNYIQEHKLKSKICAQVHDELLIETNVQEAWYVAECFRWYIERPRDYSGNQLIVPVTLAVGKNWAGDYEWKKFPTKDEFGAKVKELGLA